MMRTAVIGLVAVLVVAASLLLLALRETNRMAVAEISFASRSVENGAAIYLDACAGCHGVAGQGVAGVAPALNSVDFFTRRLAEIGYGGSLISYVESTVAAGRPVTAGQYSTTMPAWARQYGGYLRPDQVHDVATFVLNWEDEALGLDPALAVATPTPLPGLAEGASPVDLGRAVYTAAGCGGCHGQDGNPAISGPDLAGIAESGADRMPDLTAEEYIRLSIIAPSAFLAPECPTGACPDIMPRDYGDRLTQEQLDALVRYLLSL
ncbi:MAG: c-type cytochrome [Anaerolineae bacterium]|nr:c-type cytochrome [Anaerolineae bacterium]